MDKLLKVILAVAVGLSLIPDAGAVTLPYTFTSGQSIQASQVNANDQALRDAINAHISAGNPHGTTLAQILSAANSCGSTSINFNGTPALNFQVETLSADPACGVGSLGRLIWNTSNSLFKICNGTSFVSIAGTGVNTLQSVLTAGNSAGSTNLDMNFNQILNANMELRTTDPAASNGRFYYRTDTNEMRVCNGVTCTPLGGAQGLASVLGVSNSTGAVNLNFNGNQALSLRGEVLASDPGSSYSGRLYYNSAINRFKFYNGSSWLEVGNTNTLSQVMGLGNSVGANDLDVNMRQLLHARMENLASSPGTGQIGRWWMNTGDSNMYFDDGSANHAVCSVDQTQTLSNKSISGSSNTFTNIPDGALSSNVVLKTGSQTISGVKTFSSTPVVSAMGTPSGASHTLTDGLANDTFTLNNAAQTLSGKNLAGFSLSGNVSWNNFIANQFRVENRTTDPVAGNAGRIYYKSTTGDLIYDTGTQLRTLQASGAVVTNPWLVGGNTGTNPATDFFGTTDNHDVVMIANGAERLRLVSGTGVKVAGLGAGIVNSDASGNLTSTTVARSLIASGTANAVVVNDGTGALSSLGPLTNGQILIGSTGAAPVVASITGTANRVTVTPGAGTITLNGPQDIHTGASPTFVGATLSGFGTAGLVHNSNTGLLSSSLLVDADVSAAAGITRSKTASGTNYRILANNATGVMSENAALTSTQLVYADANGQLTGSANMVYSGSLLTLNTPSRLQQPFRGDTVGDGATGANATLTAPTTPIVRLTNASLTSVDGVPAGNDGQFLVLMNTTGVSVTINDNTGATTANRIRTGSGGAFVMQDQAAIFLIYDFTNSRWKMIGGAGGGRCVNTFSATTITPTSGCTDQTWAYNGGSAQTFSATGMGTISSLSNGTRFTLMGTSDTNTITVANIDAADGRLQNGDAVLGKGRTITLEYNSTLARLVEIGRNF